MSTAESAAPKTKTARTKTVDVVARTKKFGKSVVPDKRFSTGAAKILNALAVEIARDLAKNADVARRSGTHTVRAERILLAASISTRGTHDEAVDEILNV